MKPFIHILISGMILVFTDAVSQDSEPAGRSEKNEITLFAGGTSHMEDQSTHATIGLEYLRIIDKKDRWAAGAMAEMIFAEEPEFLFAGLIYYSPLSTEKQSLWVWTGPGIVYETKEEIIPPDLVEKKKVSEFVYRIGVGYFREIGRFSIGPTADMDIINGTEAFIWGINVGYGF
jgi:hypothetical protein